MNDAQIKSRNGKVNSYFPSRAPLKYPKNVCVKISHHIQRKKG